MVRHEATNLFSGAGHSVPAARELERKKCNWNLFIAKDNNPCQIVCAPTRNCEFGRKKAPLQEGRFLHHRVPRFDCGRVEFRRSDDICCKISYWHIHCDAEGGTMVRRRRFDPVPPLPDPGMSIAPNLTAANRLGAKRYANLKLQCRVPALQQHRVQATRRGVHLL